MTSPQQPTSSPSESLASTYVMQALMAADSGDQDRSSTALREAVGLGINDATNTWFALEAAYGVALQLLWEPAPITDWYLPLYTQLSADASPVTQGLARLILGKVSAVRDLPQREQELLQSYSIEPAAEHHLPSYAHLGEESDERDVLDHVGAVILATRMLLLEMMMYADQLGAESATETTGDITGADDSGIGGSDDGSSAENNTAR